MLNKLSILLFLLWADCDMLNSSVWSVEGVTMKERCWSWADTMSLMMRSLLVRNKKKLDIMMWLHLAGVTIQLLALPLCCQLFWLRCLCCIMFQFWLLNFEEYLVSLWQHDPEWQEITGGADVERVLHCGLALWGLSASTWPLLRFHLQRCWASGLSQCQGRRWFRCRRLTRFDSASVLVLASPL